MAKDLPGHPHFPKENGINETSCLGPPFRFLKNLAFGLNLSGIKKLERGKLY